MERKTFRIVIDAPREKVWSLLWNHETYPVWTRPFCEGSHARTDWQKGSRVYFLWSEKDGMISSVAENIPNEFMSFRHLGSLKEGVEDFDGPEVKPWAGAMENYTLRTVGNGTELAVDMDIHEKHEEYFNTTWPKALEKVKELAESA
ncbi:MAG TPA: SRPBCC domain-containing protein [Flavisolibacter sp.]|nr:SRPBCC domain-containing protein [Flavisolibacter sp.]